MHARGITLDGSIEEILELRKSDDIIKFLIDFCTIHSQDGAVQVYVFATGKVRMEPSSEFNESAQPSANLEFSLVWLQDSAQQFQGSTFAGAVRSNDRESISPLNVERDVA